MSQDERVSLVDEHDNIIGSKWRSELNDDECWRGVSIWVENDRGQVLIQKRSMTKRSSPGAWTPAADGTVPENGNYDETAVSELSEEIGLSGVELTKMNKVYAKYDLGWRQMQGYKTRCNWPLEKFTIEADEVAGLEWVDKKQLLQEITAVSS